MSRYKKYAEELNDLAKAKFKAYKAAENKLRLAELQRKALPDYATQLQRVEADYAAANAKRELDLAALSLESADEVSAIRARLAEEVFEEYSADPSRVDTKTLELLKSGILNEDEYMDIIERAQKNQ